MAEACGCRINYTDGPHIIFCDRHSEAHVAALEAALKTYVKGYIKRCEFCEGRITVTIDRGDGTVEQGECRGCREADTLLQSLDDARRGEGTLGGGD